MRFWSFIYDRDANPSQVCDRPGTFSVVFSDVTDELGRLVEAFTLESDVGFRTDAIVGDACHEVTDETSGEDNDGLETFTESVRRFSLWEFVNRRLNRDARTTSGIGSIP